MIPDRGAWMELETRKNDYIIIKFNRKRTTPITIFLRALAEVDDGMPDSPIQTGSDEELMALFEDVDTDLNRQFIPATIGPPLRPGTGRALQAQPETGPGHLDRSPHNHQVGYRAHRTARDPHQQRRGLG
jgi:hypothetical protein